MSDDNSIVGPGHCGTCKHWIHLSGNQGMCGGLVTAVYDDDKVERLDEVPEPKRLRYARFASSAQWGCVGWKAK